MNIALAILTGLSMGYVLERGDFCFHSTMRGLFRKPTKLDLFRAYLLVLLIAAPALFVLMQMGIVEPWIAPFNWVANLVGGLIFGLGMVVAATCVTGLFYKLGHGMLGTVVGLVGWAIGDILVYRGPLRAALGIMTANPLELGGTISPTLFDLGPAGYIITLALLAATAYYLFKAPRKKRPPHWNWRILGIATAIIIIVAWLLADTVGESYPYGTSFVPSYIVAVIAQEAPLTAWIWIPTSLFALIFGALLAAKLSGTFRMRGESLDRYYQLAIGGLLMGIGAAFAGGCNLGHSLIGVPLLSLGSIATTVAMTAGVYLGTRLGL